MDETEQERKVLNKLAELDSDAVDAYTRLMQLSEKDQDWQGLFLNAERMLAVNPLIPGAHRYLVKASAHLGHDSHAISSYRALLTMDPVDPAGNVLSTRAAVV